MKEKLDALTREEAITMLERIARQLEWADDGNDFILWLRDAFEMHAGIQIDLSPK